MDSTGTIKVFLAIGRPGRILAAAQKLRLDNATVGRRLSALKAELEVKQPSSAARSTCRN